MLVFLGKLLLNVSDCSIPDCVLSYYMALQRTVMEAVTAILGGGLRVGLLLHGKRVRDDNRTLLQTGITSEENLDTLGFTLEPTPTQPPPPVCTEDPAVLLPCDTSQLTSK